MNAIIKLKFKCEVIILLCHNNTMHITMNSIIYLFNDIDSLQYSQEFQFRKCSRKKKDSWYRLTFNDKQRTWRKKKKKNQNLISTIKFYVSVSISFDFLRPSVLFFFDSNPFKNWLWKNFFFIFFNFGLVRKNFL